MNKSDAIDKENYIPGEPIFTGDIDIPGMTEENLRYHLKKLTDSGTICRFEPGVYYFPKTDIFGERLSLSPDTVAVHKYILRRGKRVGYYSGYTLANRMGLSTQASAYSGDKQQFCSGIGKEPEKMLLQRKRSTGLLQIIRLRYIKQYMKRR